ncbi:MAG: 6,7-dimethyl-8-ribityllumazine synthase [Acidilobaceae archaeon]
MGNVRLAIVVSEFNYDVTKIMLEKALSHAKFLGATVVLVFKAPGVFDTPYAVDQIAKLEHVDAVVVLGAVIKGETSHDEVVAHQAARKLLDIGVAHGKPVALGVIGPNASRLQALERAEEYARRAVEAAVKMAKRLNELKKASYTGETLVIE